MVQIPSTCLLMYYWIFVLNILHRKLAHVRIFLITLTPFFFIMLYLILHYFWIFFYILYQTKIILQRYSQVCVWQGPSAEKMILWELRCIPLRKFTAAINSKWILQREMKICKKTQMIQNKKMALTWRETEYTEILLKALGSGDKSMQDIMKGRYSMVRWDTVLS